MTATMKVKGFDVGLNSHLQSNNGRLQFHEGFPAYGGVRNWLDCAAAGDGASTGEYDPIHSAVDHCLLEAIVQRRLLEWCLKDGDEYIRRMAQGIVLAVEDLRQHFRSPLSETVDCWRFSSAVVRNVSATGGMGKESYWGRPYSKLFRGSVEDTDLLVFVNPATLMRGDAATLKEKKLLVKPTAKQWSVIGNAMALLTAPHLRSRWATLPQIGVRKRNHMEQPQVSMPAYTLSVMLEGCRLLPEFLQNLLSRNRAYLLEDYRTMYAERQRYAVWASAFDFQMDRRMAAWDRMVYERFVRHSRNETAYYHAPLTSPISRLVPPWQGPAIAPLPAPFRSGAV